MAIVSDEQVIKVLRQYNPWWRNPLAIKEENKPQKRLHMVPPIRNWRERFAPVANRLRFFG